MKVEVRPGLEVKGVRHLSHADQLLCLVINDVFITAFEEGTVVGISVAKAMGRESSGQKEVEEIEGAPV